MITHKSLQVAPCLYGPLSPAMAAPPAAVELPTSRAEMAALGWDACDVVIVTGDAYIDHPSFGMAVIGRVLQSQGFRVGIIAQPDWKSADAFRALGAPRLFWGVTSGNMDSMVNRYTSERRIRSDDAYTPQHAAGKRPDRAVTVYAQRCREAFKGVPVVLGGIEASLRRLAHYDYWSDRVRRSVLMDSKADILVYGNGERQVIEIAHRLAAGEPMRDLRWIRGTAVMCNATPEDCHEADEQEVDQPRQPSEKTARPVLRLPSYEAVVDDTVLYAHASRILHQETNPGNARALIQQHGTRHVWMNPPTFPLLTEELDAVFDLPYSRLPHSGYGSPKEAAIPAYEMIKHSVNIMRGCFGGCTFCSITEHEGRMIQSRSEDSIAREVAAITELSPSFTGTISDLGGPTANMYRLGCNSPEIEAACRKPSCVFPDICPNLKTDHQPLIKVYRRIRQMKRIKRVLIASGVRYDLAVRSPEYVRELVTHHVGGYLKIAPEHTEAGPLSKMMKPDMRSYDAFKVLFERFSEAAGKKQYLIPYFIAAHPGTTDEDMLQLALWLKRNNYRADQVQAFLPSPMSTATAMYHSGRNPLRRISRHKAGYTERVFTAKRKKQRDLHKAFLRYHDPVNWPSLRTALLTMGRGDLIGTGEQHLIPPEHASHVPAEKKHEPCKQPFRTQQTRRRRR
ncbi:MAG: YgiQ family radical SAM protein [Mariprofundaceae bacterium]|nr:YgiQ family radical SAM protein [Mariprofundaceae bacterium]